MMPSKLYKGLILGGHRVYKLTLSPLIGQQCRFLPSCSDYMAAALIDHGLVKGLALGIGRICRCRPGGGHGFDPVPLKKL
jgi:putative membrane protein insertion efficiency factor